MSGQCFVPTGFTLNGSAKVGLGPGGDLCADCYPTPGTVNFTITDPDHANGKRAVELATKACELSEWKGYYQLDVRAMAYAEAGAFDKAVEFEKRALAIIGEPKTPFQKECAERLALFQEKKPYRFAPGLSAEPDY
jgi:hypothetical protein